MNKTRLSMLLFVVFLSLTLVGMSLAADNAKETPPFIGEKVSTGISPAVEGGGGVNSLSGSYVAFDPSVGGDICHIPGVAQTFCFRAESFTNDYAYVYNIWEKFPTNWVISNVYVQGTPVCDHGPWGPFSWSFVTSPYEVNISQPRYQQTTDHCIAYYCFDVTAGPGLMDAGVSWFWDGDEYGAPPHWPCSNDGYAPSGFTCDEAVNPVATVPLCNIEPVVWDKNIDGIPWSPGMEITRQTSDTIVVQEVLHLLPPPLASSMPFVPVIVSDQSTSGSPPTTSSEGNLIGQPEISAHPEAVLWDQPLSTVNQAGYVDQEFPDFSTYSTFLADDFINLSPWSISLIFVPGEGFSSFTSLLNASALTWQIYADNPGVPDGDPSCSGNPPVWTLTLPPTDPQVVISNGTPGGYLSNTTLNLATPINLPAGHWWLVFYPTMSFTPYGQYGRQPADTTNGYIGQAINPGGGFGGGTTWQSWMTWPGSTLPDIAFRLEGEILPPLVTQIEMWDPAHLRLLDWAATGGTVSINPGQVTWSAEILASTTITMTKWFHVEPSTWIDTSLLEELWLDGTQLEQRPVAIHKLPPELWINASGGGSVFPGQPATFTLQYGNQGGYENTTIITNTFPIEAPFQASIPPPDSQDPSGLWAEWYTDGLPMGAQGNITVTVMIQPGLPPATPIEVWDGIFNHMGELADWVIIPFQIASPDIMVTPLTLEMTLQTGETDTLPITITNVGLADLTWNLIDGADWLGENPIYGSILPGESKEVAVTFDTSGLIPEVYDTNIVIASNDPDEPSISLPVTLTVIAPDIEVTPLSLEMTLLPDEIGTLPFTINNVGSYDLIWSLADGAPWLSEDPTSSTILPGESKEVTVTFNATGLAPGVYDTTIVITSNDPDEPSINLPVSLTVKNYSFFLPLTQRR